ncbi:MAG TPA: alpha/beta hydrolase-fold protein [Acidobacteriaceae bacterium]
MRFLSFLAVLVCASATCLAQGSYDVHSNGSITFHLTAPGAKAVELGLEGAAKPLPMTRDASGIWSVTTEKLAPEIYGYSFTVDGVRQLDPLSTDARDNYIFLWNNVLVPGTTPEPWELQAIPHGAVTHHVFTTKNVEGLPAGQEDYYVYTPPGYDPRRVEAYPVLYLLHGWSDKANAWTAAGHADRILDTLIDAGKAKPMVVVMPLGYGTMHTLQRGKDLKTLLYQNTGGFSRVLLEEVMPQVERAYHVRRDRNGRAIAGLSMGGLESVTVGLAHTERFAWIGSFSGAFLQSAPPTITPEQAKLRLLWIACGTEDGLLNDNRTEITGLKQKGFTVNTVETPGMHTWMVWRDNLIHFAPLLFKQTAAKGE